MCSMYFFQRKCRGFVESGSNLLLLTLETKVIIEIAEFKKIVEKSFKISLLLWQELSLDVLQSFSSC